MTDPQRIIASPLTTVATHDLEAFLKDYFEHENVTEAVIGYPVTVNNLPSESVEYIKPFIARFKKLFPLIPLHLIDERFTSHMAMQAMIEGGVKKSSRRNKAMIDRVSASIILQSWMSREKNF